MEEQIKECQRELTTLLKSEASSVSLFFIESKFSYLNSIDLSNGVNTTSLTRANLLYL
jgi:two-component SAPR family response regulator